MSFETSHPTIQGLRAKLVNITGEAIADPPGAAKPLRRFSKAVAEFDDGEKLKFPEDTVLYPDNHVPDGVAKDADATKDKRIQVRLRVVPKNGPAFHIPRGVSKQYVVDALRRIELGV